MGLLLFMYLFSIRYRPFPGIPQGCGSDGVLPKTTMDFIKRDLQLCKSGYSKEDLLNQVSSFCSKSDFVAMTLNYLPRIEFLEPILNEFNSKVIHLVRDPRATIVSWINAWHNVAPNKADINIYR